jgi:hypothetical protein
MLRSFRLILGLLVGLLASQTRAQTDTQTAPPAAVVNDAVQGGWSVDDIQRTANYWEAITTEQSDNNAARFNQFRSERNASLARNSGVLPAQDKAQLDELAKDMARSAPNGFEAQLARYYLEFPAPAAYPYLEQAAATAPQRDELLGPLLVNAARKGAANELVAQARAFEARGQVKPGLWSLADDLLASVDQNGVLVVAGDMDALPVLVRQQVHQLRRDVLVIDQRLLADPGYRQRMWTLAKGSGAVPGDAEGFKQALLSRSGRPVFLSLALGREQLAKHRANTYSTGLALRYSTKPVDNIPLLASRWAAFKKPTDAGPLARNYLLPGAILLEHFRTIGDETKAAQLEYELRQFAKAIGATDLLYRTGTLQH